MFNSKDLYNKIPSLSSFSINSTTIPNDKNKDKNKTNNNGEETLFDLETNIDNSDSTTSFNTIKLIDTDDINNDKKYCEHDDIILDMEKGVYKQSRTKFNDEFLRFYTKELTVHQILQLKKIKKMVEDTTAYSQYYYHKAKIWKFVYWFTSILSIFLTGINSILNTVFDPCSYDSIIQKYNTIFGFMITLFLGIITFINASRHNQVNETAGDKYQTLSEQLFNKVFLSKNELKNLNYEEIIKNYYFQLNTLREIYPEPSVKDVRQIKKSTEFVFINQMNNIIFV